MSLSLQCNYNAKTSKHSNRMHTVPLCCLYIIQWPLDVTSKVIWGQDLYRGEEVWAGTLHGKGRGNCTYSEVQYIMGNGHMGNHPMNR